MRNLKKFKLDTDNFGEDDILVGASFEEVLQDVLNYYEIDKLPENWSISEIDYEEE